MHPPTPTVDFMATEQLTDSQKDHLVIATEEGNLYVSEVGNSVGQWCQFCALLSTKESEKKSVVSQQCGIMKGGPDLNLRGTSSRLSFALICMIFGKSPNSFGLRALICKIRAMFPKNVFCKIQVFTAK